MRHGTGPLPAAGNGVAFVQEGHHDFRASFSRQRDAATAFVKNNTERTVRVSDHGWGLESVRIRIGGDSFCDSSSIRLSFIITNNDTGKSLKFFSGPWGAWGMVRLLSQETEIERLDLYGRHHEVFGFQLLPFQEQWTEAAVCGLHGSFGSGATSLQPQLGTTEAGERAAVMHKLHLSLFESKKIIPLRFCPLAS